MSRMIDADKLKQHYAWWQDEDQKRLFDQIVDLQPTAEKTGRWIDAEWENINTGEKRKGRRCSNCGSGYFRYDVSVNTVSDIPRYCPNCGAHMGSDWEGEGHW